MITGESGPDSNWAAAAEERCIILTDWLAVGRGTEVGLSSWNSAYWSPIHNAFFLNWMELKVSRQKIMAFVNDALGYKLDYFHAMFFYLASGNGIVGPSDSQQRIFPHLSRNNAAIAAKDISVILKKCYGKVDGLHAGPTSKDLRSGPVVHLFMHPQGGVEICAARGGWMIDDLVKEKTGALIFYLTC